MKGSVAGGVALCALLLAVFSGSTSAMEGTPSGDNEICLIDVRQVPRMPADELNAGLNDPSLVLIDVRADADWNESPTKIKGAIREVFEKIEEWAPNYDKDKTIVLYCA